MTARIRNIVFEAPDPDALAAFYAELLGMEFLRLPPDWLVVGRDGEYPRLAFDLATDYHPPQWPDPAHPQQLHLDIHVPDLAGTERRLPERGATRLPSLGGDCHVWADPAGHPFCLCEDPGRLPYLNNVVLDSADHSGLAAFYTGLLGYQKVGSEWDDWITIGDNDGPKLAFAKVESHQEPRWPDPGYPQQIHLDIQVEGQEATCALAVRLGGTRLPDMGGSEPVFADPAGHPFCVVEPYKPSSSGWSTRPGPPGSVSPRSWTHCSAPKPKNSGRGCSTHLPDSTSRSSTLAPPGPPIPCRSGDISNRGTRTTIPPHTLRESVPGSTSPVRPDSLRFSCHTAICVRRRRC